MSGGFFFQIAIKAAKHCWSIEANTGEIVKELRGASKLNCEVKSSRRIFDNEDYFTEIVDAFGYFTYDT